MRAYYVLACLAVLVAVSGAANIRPSVTAVNNQLYRRYVCANKEDGFRALVPGSCSNYYECQSGLAIETVCSRFFDAKVKQCVNYNTGCIEVKQTASVTAIGGNSAAPCAETVTTPCAPVVTTPCAPVPTTPCAPETTTTCTPATTTTCTTTTCTPATTTTCTTTTCTPATTTTTTTHAPATTTTCTTTTCTPATTTTCTTTTCTPATTTTCTPATTTTCTTTTCTPATTTSCAPVITTPCGPETTTTCGPAVTTKCAPSSGKVVPSSLSVRPVVRPSGPLPEVAHQPIQMASAPSELNMDLYTSYVCRSKPDGFMLASLTSCNNYYICRYGMPLQVSCGQKYFNALKGICDLPENTRCVQPQA
ncbi:integumentary mucin C.1 isoform X2 [Drosophila innubila]|uniref:integumentary mucin C.1 isoform X2 n=1 Tax=Drosophila innubila TaxID=198719 RepID=UPI00148C0F6B|nr:integumentary mucin C.1 isoform X2 [Drosophila innubila]